MLSPYLSLLSLPGAAAFVCGGFAARMAHLTTVLGIVFAVSHSTGAYGWAGVVSGAYALAYAAVAPMVSRLADRRGQTGVLIAATGATLLSRTGLLAALALRAPEWGMVVLAAACGASMPGVAAFVRARWQHLAGASPHAGAATSFESVIDELLLIVGPVVVTACATYLHPAAGLVLSVPLSVGGLAVLAAQRRTAPPVAPGGGHPRGTALSTPGLPALLIIFALVSGVITTVNLGIVAFSERHDAAALSGWVLAATAASSATGGLWYGARRWSSSPRRRLLVVLPVLVACTVPFLAVTRMSGLFAAAALLGFVLAPTLICGYSIVGTTVPPHHLTEGLTWMTTAAGLGIALGSAAAGRMIDTHGAGAAFTVATGVAALATAIALTAGRVRGPAGRSVQ
jgi:MFS family permease